MKIMSSKALVFAVIVLFVGAGAVPSISSNVSNSNAGNTLYVGGSGSGNYSSIQSAISDANDGDTVFVYDDSSPYYENIPVDKSITLIGENRNTTIIDGGEKGNVLYVTADDMRISGFTIKNSCPRYGCFGIALYSGNNVIENNIITDNHGGIHLDFRCYDSTVSANEICYNEFCGIWLDEGTNGNTILNNDIYNNNFSGLVIHEGTNTIFNNTIRSNQQYGIHIHSSNDNLIYHNNFIENNQHAFTFNCGNNVWNRNYPIGGNYFDDYSGLDIFHGPEQNKPGGDGFGDTIYNIAGDGNVDNYPLIQPWGINTPPSVPDIAGPLNGKPGEIYSFHVNSIDLNGDDIYYWIEWGDGIEEGWLGPHTSGSEIILNHTWENKGKYNLKIKTKDEHDAESDWATQEVSMPKNKATNTPFLNFLENHLHMFPILRQLLRL